MRHDNAKMRFFSRQVHLLDLQVCVIMQSQTLSVTNKKLMIALDTTKSDEYTASNLSPALQTNPTGTPPTAGSLPSGPAPASSGTGGGNGDNGNIGDPTRTPAGSSGDDTGAKVGAAIGGIVTPFVILVISLVVYKNFIMTPAKPQKYHQSTSTYVPPQYK